MMICFSDSYRERPKQYQILLGIDTSNPHCIKCVESSKWCTFSQLLVSYFSKHSAFVLLQSHETSPGTGSQGHPFVQRQVLTSFSSLDIVKSFHTSSDYEDLYAKHKTAQIDIFCLPCKSISFVIYVVTLSQLY